MPYWRDSRLILTTCFFFVLTCVLSVLNAFFCIVSTSECDRPQRPEWEQGSELLSSTSAGTMQRYTYDCCLWYEQYYIWKDPNLHNFRSCGLFVTYTVVLSYFQYHGWTFLFMRTSRMQTIFNKCSVNTLKEKDYRRSPK